MEIRFSRYNAPFCEPETYGVHYIPLDDQREMRAGLFNSHVRLYRSQSHPHIVEISDPLSGSTFMHDLGNQSYFAPFASKPDVSLTDDEIEFLQELHQDFGIKPAAKRLAEFWQDSN